MTSIPIDWIGRQNPLILTGVAGTGDAARALAKRLLQKTEEAVAGVYGLVGPQLLILLAEESLLPWTDGVLYLGRDEQALSLLLPTNRQPSIPVQLLQQALLRLPVAPPIVVLPDPIRLISVAGARPLAFGKLRRWIEEES